MFCKKKQIQSRKLINEARNHSKNFAGTHVIKIKNGQKKQLGPYCDEKSYQIDPWYIKSNSKFEQITSKNLNDFSLSKQVKRRTAKRNGRDIAIVKKNDNKPKENSRIQPKFEKVDLNYQSISPTKIDMLQCSFRFEQYEHQKAEQLKSSFLNKLFQQAQSRKNPSIQRNKNFIQKNIKEAFQLQGLSLESYIHSQRKRTIQQSKQQLLLNKEKLKQESKELHTFISMKEQDQNRKSYDTNKEKISPQTASFWHMSYVDKSHNPQTFSRNFIQHLTFDKMLKRKKKIQRSKTVQLRKSPEKKRSGSFFIQNNLPEENQQFFKDIDQSKTKQFKIETKKFNRILKLRNKSTLIVTNKQNEDYSQIKHDRKKHHQNRIHSSPGKGSKEDSKQSNGALYSNNYLSKFENIQISKFVDLQSKHFIKKSAKPRSVSACMTKNQIINLSDRSIFKKYQNQRKKVTQELFVQGSMCEIKNIYPL